MKTGKDDIQCTLAAPQSTAVASQGTAVAPQGTAVAPQGTAVAPQGTAAVPVSSIPGASYGNSGKLISSGSQAEIILTEYNGTECVMRLFKPGYGPNAEVGKALRRLYGKGLVTEVLETGTRDGRMYEIMPYYANGSVADYDFRGKATEILTIAIKTAMCLDAMHKAHVMHKDIKPANILVADISCLDTVICDFGIADIISGGKVVTKQFRTPIYAAPELYDPKKVVARLDGQDLFEITPAADFYSLGMTILCLWYGEKAFSRKEQEMAVAKLKGGIKVPDDMPDNLATLAEGLLQKDPNRRWGFKEIRDMLVPEVLGEYGIRLFLNPLCDMRLNPNPKSPDYIATGEQMGKFLNDVYLWHFAGAEAPADKSLCCLVLDSFKNYKDSYLQVYFDRKGDFFKEYADWTRKCIGNDYDTRKIATTDPQQRFQISMMKTIKGLGFKPVYTFKDTGETISDIAGLKKAGADKKQALESGGLRGWLAVQYQEDPEADFSGHFAYENALMSYLETLTECDPTAREARCFSRACNEQEELAGKVRNAIRGKIVRGWLQLLLSVIALVVSEPLVRSFVGMAKADPSVGSGILDHMWIFAVIGIIAGIWIWLESESFLLGILTFGGVSFVSIFIVKLATDYMMWIMAALAIAAGIFAFVTLVIALWPDKNAMSPSDVHTDDENAVVECLDYAFREPDKFDSSLNGFLTDGRMYRWKNRLDGNRKRIIICFCCIALLAAGNILFAKTTTNDVTQDETIEEVL